MTPLSDQQKQLLFDYSMGMTSDRETVEAEKLLSRNEAAVELHRTLKLALAPLDSLEPDPCPDDLTDRLFLRLKAAAQQGSDLKRLEELLEAERSVPRRIRIPLWRNWSEVVTAAAAVFLFISILFPSIGFMRQRYGQTHCGSQQASIYGGILNYMSDHDGLLPAVAAAPDAPWWKVGDPGQENCSNTRRLWLLVRHKYVTPEQFVCPGRREEHKVNYDGIPIERFSDFPSGIYIQFSFRIPCPTFDDRNLKEKGVLLADRNPLSENLPSDLSQSCRLPLDEKQMRANSLNHRGRGQNVLFDDGSVRFERARHTSISDDDIYLLRSMFRGMEIRGCERPSSLSDIFLAP